MSIGRDLGFHVLKFLAQFLLSEEILHYYQAKNAKLVLCVIGLYLKLVSAIFTKSVEAKTR